MQAEPGCVKFGDPQVWGPEKLSKVARHLAEVGKSVKFDLRNRTHVPYVRAVNYKGESVNLKSWV